MKAGLRRHGNTHLAAGSDPIPGLTIPARIVRGQVYNDANIIAGTGFTADLTSATEITVTFDEAFDDPPTVLLTPNNNNPADMEGEYGVTQTSVSAGDFVVTGTEFDGTPNIGGFNFAAIETGPAA